MICSSETIWGSMHVERVNACTFRMTQHVHIRCMCGLTDEKRQTKRNIIRNKEKKIKYIHRSVCVCVYMFFVESFSPNFYVKPYISIEYELIRYQKFDIPRYVRTFVSFLCLSFYYVEIKILWK